MPTTEHLVIALYKSTCNDMFLGIVSPAHIIIIKLLRTHSMMPMLRSRSQSEVLHFVVTYPSVPDKLWLQSTTTAKVSCRVEEEVMLLHYRVQQKYQ